MSAWTSCPLCGSGLEATLELWVDLDSYDPLSEDIGGWVPTGYGTEVVRVYCHNDCDWTEAIEALREARRKA